MAMMTRPAGRLPGRPLDWVTAGALFAVIAERLRIARELHDVVAHSMSVIAVQSAVGAQFPLEAVPG